MDRVVTEPGQVAVVRRDRADVYERLMAAGPEARVTEVIWDRRFRDRRTRAVWRPPDRTERRGDDRRSRPPATWEHEGYLLAARRPGTPSR